MKKYKRNKTFAWLVTIFGVILVGVASWGFYNIVNTGVEDILLRFGVESPYAQSFTVVIIALVILSIMGTGLFKAINAIIGR